MDWGTRAAVTVAAFFAPTGLIKAMMKAWSVNEDSLGDAGKIFMIFICVVLGLTAMILLNVMITAEDRK